MHTFNEKNEEEKLNRLFTAAREEPLLASMDDAGARLGNVVPEVKNTGSPKLTVIYRALIIAGILCISGLAIYFLKNETAYPPVKPSSDKPVATPLPAAIAENNRGKESGEKSEIKENNNQDKNAMVPKSAAGIPVKSNAKEPRKESIFFEGHARIEFDFQGKHVQMIADNEVKELTIDGNKIGEKDFAQYDAIIRYGMDIKREQDRQQKKNTGDQSQENKIIMQALIDQLSSFELIKENEPFDFYLQGNRALLNGSELDADKFAGLKSAYEQAAGNKLEAKASIHIKH